MKQYLTYAISLALSPYALNTNADMLLADSLEDIEKIVVQGQRNTLSIDLSGQTAHTAQADLRDLLFQLPGVDINGNGPLSGILQYRGLFGDRVAVEQQGGPIIGSGPNGMDSPMSHFIARPGATIVLHPGIAPVTMGPESLGGLIEFRTDADALFALQPHLRGGAAATYQSQGDATLLSSHLGYHSDEAFIQVFAQRQQRNNIRSGNGERVANTFYERDAWGLDAGWQNDNHRIMGHYQRIETGPSGTAALDMDIVFVASERYQLAYEWRQLQRHIRVQAFGNNNQHDMNNFIARQLMSPAMARLNSVDSNAQGYEVEWVEHMSIGVLTLGSDHLSATHNSTIVNPQTNMLRIGNFNRAERDTTGMYAQWETQWDAVHWTAGLRYNQIEATAGEVSHSMASMNPAIASLVERFNSAPREQRFNYLDWTLAMAGDFNAAWQWHAGIAQKHRAPSYTEMFVWLPLGISGGMADGRNYLGNLQLREERANKIDLALTYQGDQLQLTPRLFYDEIKDYIVGSPATDPAAIAVSSMMSGRPPLQWENADVRVYGMDVLLSAALTPAWHLQASAQAVRADRRDLNEPLFRIAPASLFTQLTWKQDQLSATLESLLVARQGRTSGILDEAETAGYGVVNLSGHYVLSPQLTLTVGVNNLLDKFYQPHLNGVNRVTPSHVSLGEALPEAGRNWVVSIASEF